MAKNKRGGRRNNTSPTPPNPNKKGQHPGRNDELIEYLTKASTTAVSSELAVQRTNPNYSKGREYQENCQRCVWAYELQRRGYDVEALPTFKGDDLPSQGRWKLLNKVCTNPENNVYVGQHFGQTNSIKTEITNITDAMTNWGDGSRGIVRVKWKNSLSGHVFNIENQGGKIKAFDGQTGKEINLRDYLSRASRGYTSLVRSDNAVIDMDQISKYIKLRGK